MGEKVDKVKHLIKNKMPLIFKSLKRIYFSAIFLHKYYVFLRTLIHKIIFNRFNVLINSRKSKRYLEIGPGKVKKDGFEAMNIVWSKSVDYIYKTSKIPFSNCSFDYIYASHVIEHIPWYELEETLGEWCRVLKSNGVIELWFPNGFELAKYLTDIEYGKIREEHLVHYIDRVGKTNPWAWCNFHLLYGLNPNYPSWHKSILTPQTVNLMLARLGLTDIIFLNDNQHGDSHGWIDFGIRASKL